MMRAPRILFLDDDHVLRNFRLILTNREEPALRDWLAPEQVDLEPLLKAVQGLRTSEGAVIGQVSDPAAPVTDADILVTRREEVGTELLDRHPSLRLVQRLGERAEGIDLAETQRRGIQVSCLPRRTLHYTAEHVLMLALALSKKLLQSDSAVRAGTGAGLVPAADGSVYNWAGIPGSMGLRGSTIGIVGLGEVGSLVARLAGAFGMTVLYYKPRRASAQIEAALGVEYVPLPVLLTRSDCVSLNIPVRPETHGYANAAFFASMKHTAFFLNTSRGQLVDEDALYGALTGGVIAGAGLDVHAIEPRPACNRFASLPNVILTPHLAGGARSGVLAEFEVIARNCSAAMHGRLIEHLVG
jgi:phosphoglycerate dehydrogenase-like enzyme